MDIAGKVMHYEFVYSTRPETHFLIRGLFTIFRCMDLIKKQWNKH